MDESSRKRRGIEEKRRGRGGKVGREEGDEKRGKGRGGDGVVEWWIDGV